MADKNESKSAGGGNKGKNSPTKKKGSTPTKSSPKEEVKPNVSDESKAPDPEQVVASPVKEEKKETPLEEKVGMIKDYMKELGMEEFMNQGVDEDDDDEEDVEGAVGGVDFSDLKGWFNNTLLHSKAKCESMMEFLMQDINEFSETVSEVGRDLRERLKIDESAKSAVNVVTEGMNVALEQMSTIFGVGPEDDDEQIVVAEDPHVGVVNRVNTRIYALTMDENVYLSDPEEKAKYEKWKGGFDMETENMKYSELLAANPHLQLHYSQFVPEKVSHLDFWSRFYYRVKIIVDEEADRMQEEVKLARKARIRAYDKRDAAIAAAAAAAASAATGAGDAGAAPIDDLGGDPSMVEISEEDQKRLLAEYEEELKRGDESEHSRRSSGTQMSSSSSGSFAFVTRDPDTNEPKIE